MDGTSWPFALKHVPTVMVLHLSAEYMAPTCFRPFLANSFDFVLGSIQIHHNCKLGQELIYVHQKYFFRN